MNRRQILRSDSFSTRPAPASVVWSFPIWASNADFETVGFSVRAKSATSTAATATRANLTPSRAFKRSNPIAARVREGERRQVQEPRRVVEDLRTGKHIECRNVQPTGLPKREPDADHKNRQPEARLRKLSDAPKREPSEGEGNQTGVGAGLPEVPSTDIGRRRNRVSVEVRRNEDRREHVDREVETARLAKREFRANRVERSGYRRKELPGREEPAENRRQREPPDRRAIRPPKSDPRQTQKGVHPGHLRVRRERRQPDAKRENGKAIPRALVPRLAPVKRGDSPARRGRKPRDKAHGGLQHPLDRPEKPREPASGLHHVRELTLADQRAAKTER